MIRSVDVACPAAACPAVGQARRVHLRTVALGVIEWPTLRCAGCATVMQQAGGWSAIAPDEGSVPSPGSNSATSPARPQQSSGPTKSGRPTTAPDAVPGSTRPRRRAGAAGTAPSTATCGPATGGER